MNKLRRLVLILKSYTDTALPVGVTEFNKWAAEVLELVGPIADEESLKFALATQIIHLDPKKSSVPMQYFVRCLRKSAANQVASFIFQEIKNQQAARIEAAKNLPPQLPSDTVAQQDNNGDKTSA